MAAICVLNGNIRSGAGLVSLTSAEGSISDAGANDIITAGRLTGSAETGVTLSDPNLVGTLGPFTNNASGNILDIGNGQSLTTSGAIQNLTGGSLTLTIGNGGALTVNGTVLAGAITLAADNTMTITGMRHGRLVLDPVYGRRCGRDVGTAPGGSLLGPDRSQPQQGLRGDLADRRRGGGDVTITAPISAPAGWHALLSLISNGATGASRLGTR